MEADKIYQLNNAECDSVIWGVKVSHSVLQSLLKSEADCQDAGDPNTFITLAQNGQHSLLIGDKEFEVSARTTGDAVDCFVQSDSAQFECQGAVTQRLTVKSAVTAAEGKRFQALSEQDDSERHRFKTAHLPKSRLSSSPKGQLKRKVTAISHTIAARPPVQRTASTPASQLVSNATKRAKVSDSGVARVSDSGVARANSVSSAVLQPENQSLRKQLIQALSIKPLQHRYIGEKFGQEAFKIIGDLATGANNVYSLKPLLFDLVDISDPNFDSSQRQRVLTRINHSRGTRGLPPISAEEQLRVSSGGISPPTTSNSTSRASPEVTTNKSDPRRSLSNHQSKSVSSAALTTKTTATATATATATTAAAAAATTTTTTKTATTTTTTISSVASTNIVSNVSVNSSSTKAVSSASASTSSAFRSQSSEQVMPAQSVSTRKTDQSANIATFNEKYREYLAVKAEIDVQVNTLRSLKESIVLRQSESSVFQANKALDVIQPKYEQQMMKFVTLHKALRDLKSAIQQQ